MPAGDRTGPEGMGSRTGRGAGFCNGNPMPGYMNSGGSFGRGRRPFMGGGRHGYRNWFHATGQPAWARFRNPGWGYAPEPAPFTPEDEQEMLVEQEKWLKEQLVSVQNRLAGTKTED